MALKYSEVRVPLSNLSYTPDIPSAALQPGEYNIGRNVETDTRGIRAVFGDVEILSTIPGTCTFVSAGYRFNNVWWFVVASVSNGTEGRWYMFNTASTSPINITPGVGANPSAFIAGYTFNLPITDTWNGTTLFLNDSVGAPMYLIGGATELVRYSQNNAILTTTAATGNGTTATLSFAPQAAAPFAVGTQIVISNGVPVGYNGTYTVTACTTTTVSYLNTTTGAQTTPAQISAAYQWNYTPGWQSVTAGFMREYSTPNVGSILIAGNLTARLTNGTTQQFPTTVQWSQQFGLNDGPLTWAPTQFNVANQLEIPVRGPVIDGFPCNGNFYVCSYWDTVVFSPISYQGTNTPVLGIKLLNQGRGLLNENCWANTDNLVYGVDARDIWVFDGGQFKSIGNQRVKNWFYANLNPLYYERIFVQNNSSRNQIEIYFPDLTSTGWCNRMLAYRYDLDVFQAPRDVDTASHAVESPRITGTVINSSTRGMVYSRAVNNSRLVQKDTGTSFLGNTAINSSFERTNINLGLDYSQQALIHRVLPEIVNIDTAGLQQAPVGNITIAIGGSQSVGQVATFTPDNTIAIGTDNPWVQAQQNAYRIYSVRANNSSSTNTWEMSALTWQLTPTQDSR